MFRLRLALLALKMISITLAIGAIYHVLRATDTTWVTGELGSRLGSALALGVLSNASANIRLRALQTMIDREAGSMRRPFELLLRPFSVDNRTSVRNPGWWALPVAPAFWYRSRDVSIELALTEVLSIPVRVLGGDVVGPGVVRVEDAEWRDHFDKMARAAETIVAVPIGGSEIPWELARLQQLRLLGKTVCFLPSLRSFAQAHKLRILEEHFDVQSRLRQAGFEIPPIDVKMATWWAPNERGEAEFVTLVRDMHVRQICRFLRNCGR
jgi:hypothetical protein